jgi:mannosyltransferase OCH1-like enzyme
VRETDKNDVVLPKSIYPVVAIPKIIYQTFKTNRLPLINRWYINRFRKANPGYGYSFFTDADIDSFILSEYGGDTCNAYRKIQIGAAKADFFRYALLYKRGGVYLDIDSSINGKLDDFIQDTDTAIITSERNPGLYVQWALIYAPAHPFLQRTLERVLQNIAENKYPHDVSEMTGPSVYTKAINDCILTDPGTSYRTFGVDYNGHLKFKIPLAKGVYKKGEHWKQQQLTTPVLRPGVG